jgi:cellulose synthase/poly-beta-1,6-N-acetylglucosamine synthase-like glycosyltransferase
MISEVYKEMFLATVWQTGYSWNDFPLQLCSMPMYFGVMYPFLKGKAKQTVTTFLATFNLLGGFAAIFDPTCSFYSYITMTFHSITWHFVLIFMGLHLWISGKKIFHFAYAEILYLLLGALAYLLNFLLMGISKNTMNLFFVGPGPAPVIFFDGISEKYGPVPETLLFLYISSLAACAVYFIGKVVHNKITSKKEVKSDEI